MKLKLGRRLSPEDTAFPAEINYSMNISFGSFECKQNSGRVMHYTMARSLVDWDFGRFFAHPRAHARPFFSIHESRYSGVQSGTLVEKRLPAAGMNTDPFVLVNRGRGCNEASTTHYIRDRSISPVRSFSFLYILFSIRAIATNFYRLDCTGDFIRSFGTFPLGI